MSLAEAVANVAVGFGLAVVTQPTVFPCFGMRLSMPENLAVGAIFTAVSIVRSYCLRRLFEALRVRATDLGASHDNREIPSW
jgi:hypothetical protein